MKNLCLLAALFSKYKLLTFGFLMNQILQQSFIIFEKLRNRGQLLLKYSHYFMANTFKLHKYQKLVLIKMHNMSKI